ncbi:MAG: hypothetical protein IPJ50_06630 [Betaproteobacteria bacterium]|nr:hypothetical protein [Betaproteobacteria bacterium]
MQIPQHGLENNANSSMMARVFVGSGGSALSSTARHRVADAVSAHPWLPASLIAAATLQGATKSAKSSRWLKVAIRKKASSTENFARNFAGLGEHQTDP